MTVRAITFGDVVRYTTLPGIVPRVRSLIGTGFGSFALFVALVYRAVRLLPEGHPYLNPANLGRFGVVAVVTEAWRHIWFNRRHLGQKNIDQIVVFTVILAAILILVLQFCTLALAILMPSAMAFSFPGGASFSNPFAMFDTPNINPSTMGGNKQNFYDLSFMFLDRVFGVPGMFNSCIADAVANSCKPTGSMYGAGSDISINDPATFPWPFHHALHGIFQFYSVGLLVVAVFLLIYFAIVVVAETAQTGTPFGKRFNTLWAPLRLVFAAGLLIPISFGLNAGQYIVLYAAKAGANFASNGWIGFNQTLMSANGTMLGSDKSLLIGKPGIPDASELVQFTTLMQTCRTIEDTYLTPRTSILAGNNISAQNLSKIRPYLVRPRGQAAGDPVALEMTDTLTYDDAVQWSLASDVVIRFGIEDKDKFKGQKGNVYPFCGEVVIPTVVYPALKGDTVPNGMQAPAYYQEGATMIMRFYWDILRFLVFKVKDGEGYPTVWTSTESLPWNVYEKIGKVFYENYFTLDNPTPSPDANLRRDMIKYINVSLNNVLTEGQKREAANSSDPYAVNGDLLVRGWAGAGIWYNRIAEVNGGFTAAAWNLPRVSMYPATMEHLAQRKQESQVTTSPQEIFSPYVQNEKLAIAFPRGADEERAADVYWQITKWWQGDGAGFNTSSRAVKSGNVILDIINFLFGTSGLFSIRENANIHPLAQLSTIGKSLIERSVTLLGVGLAGTAMQPWLPKNQAGLRTAMGVISGFAFSILSIGAAAGFVLYYIIPFLPFIYFFFAVAGWVKAIFEAMVGVPLWALAHIRIDGNGLPGDAAMNGYYLILEIMLRPILIVFGLVASVAIYAASVQVLNDIFNLAVANVAGINMDETMANQSFTMENLRGSIDTFFYTVVYVILVYMLGMSSFKLIDLIPGSLLRWMGSGASPFQDSGDQAAGQLVGYGTMGGNMAFGQLASAAQSGVGGVSTIGKAVMDMGKKP